MIDYHGIEETVRLIGVDCPESVHPDSVKNTKAGMEASAFTKAQLENARIELEFDKEQRDRYGRLLAYVYLDGKMFNLTLVEQGHATAAEYPPNVKYSNIFAAAQKETVPAVSETSSPGTEAVMLPPVSEVPAPDNGDTGAVSASDLREPNGSRQIYITKSGKRYHYDATCNGGTYYPATMEEVRRRNLAPCNKCVI